VVNYEVVVKENATMKSLAVEGFIVPFHTGIEHIRGRLKGLEGSLREWRSRIPKESVPFCGWLFCVILSFEVTEPC
jgi:hypothetical protein